MTVITLCKSLWNVNQSMFQMIKNVTCSPENMVCSKLYSSNFIRVKFESFKTDSFWVVARVYWLVARALLCNWLGTLVGCYGVLVVTRAYCWLLCGY